MLETILLKSIVTGAPAVASAYQSKNELSGAVSSILKKMLSAALWDEHTNFLL